MNDFVYGEDHRWYTDPKKCPHQNESVCEFCDFDGYYAKKYSTCPWGKAEVDLFDELDKMGVGDEDES